MRCLSPTLILLLWIVYLRYTTLRTSTFTAYYLFLISSISSFFNLLGYNSILDRFELFLLSSQLSINILSYSVRIYYFNPLIHLIYALASSFYYLRSPFTILFATLTQTSSPLINLSDALESIIVSLSSWVETCSKFISSFYIGCFKLDPNNVRYM